MNELISINLIDDNPYQSRSTYDEAAILELATDIAAHGLLQPVLARSTPDGRYQLAFGHRRLRAYHLLHDRGNYGYNLIPAEVREISDEQLALYAWSENAQRQDLTPLEEARAIQQMLEQFGWTQSATAERIGLDRSTVANKLRLLRLPDDVQQLVQTRQISERQAQAAAPILTLPDEIQARAQQWQHWKYIHQQLAEGASSDAIRTTADQLLRHISTPLANAPFALDAPAWTPAAHSQMRPADLRQPTCNDCPMRLPSNWCADKPCYERKKQLFYDRRLAEAAAEAGLPWVPWKNVDGSNYNRQGYQLFSNYGDTEAKALDQASIEHCPNLHLTTYESDYGGYIRPDDQTQIAYVCWHDGQPKRCHCIHKAEQAADAAKIPAEKARKADLNHLKHAAIEALAGAILAGDTGALRAIAWTTEAYNANAHRDRVLAEQQPANLAHIISAWAVYQIPLQYAPGPYRDEIARIFAAWGLPIPDVCAQTPANPQKDLTP